MAGRPQRSALIAEIDRAGGWQVLLDRWLDGESWSKIARDFKVSRAMLVEVRDLDTTTMTASDGERKSVRDILSRLRETRAEALAEAAGDVLDDVDTIGTLAGVYSREEIALAKMRSEYRRWLAGKEDSRYADHGKGGTSIVLNVGSLHLAALRQRTAPPPPDVAFEVLESTVTPAVARVAAPSEALGGVGLLAAQQLSLFATTS